MNNIPALVHFDDRKPGPPMYVVRTGKRAWTIVEVSEDGELCVSDRNGYIAEPRKQQQPRQHWEPDDIVIVACEAIDARTFRSFRSTLDWINETREIIKSLEEEKGSDHENSTD